MGISIKLCFRPSVIKGKDGTLYYQIIIKRTTHTYTSGYRIYPDEWGKRHSRIVTNSNSLIKIKNRTDWETQQIYAIIKRHIDKGTYLDFGNIISEFEELNRQQSFSDFLLSQAKRLADMGRTRTSETYISALHSFIKFNNNEDIMLYEITAEVMEDYERYLKNRNLTMNSISFYMRTLRTVLNKAVKLHLIESIAPFQSVYTGIAQTAKRAIDIDSIKRIKEVDLSLYPHLAYARDIFLLSLSLRGMSFIDMAYLTYDNLRNGYLAYYRRKTGGRLDIRWEQQMQAIIDKYPKDSRYLLPILTNDADDRQTYKKLSKRINRHLRKVGEMAQLPIPLTMYVARHSWASIAKQKQIPISVISDALGHDSEKTTLIYLSVLDTSAVDNANSEILAALGEW